MCSGECGRGASNPAYLAPGFYRATRAYQIERSLSNPRITVYRYHCPFRDEDRTLRHQGDCVLCGRRTWAADDGENDPRGIMGLHALFPFRAKDYDMEGADVVACWSCGDTYETNKLIEDYAMRFIWREPQPST